jgi:large subunit ribosomal protein L22
MEIEASAKNLRVSAKKIRPIVVGLRGAKAVNVIEALSFVPKKGSTPLVKVLKSAVANAKNNRNLKEDQLVIKEIFIDEGPTMKRFRPVSRGSAHSILKRTSNIKVILEAN